MILMPLLSLVQEGRSKKAEGRRQKAENRRQKLRIIVGWVERSQTQQKIDNVGFHLLKRHFP